MRKSHTNLYISIILALIIALFSGCAGKEPTSEIDTKKLFEEALTRIRTSDNVSYKNNVKLELYFTVERVVSNTTMIVDAHVDASGDHVHMESTVNTITRGTSRKQKQEEYIAPLVDNEGKLEVFINSDNTWRRREVEASQWESISPEALLTSELAAQMELKNGTKRYNKTECYVVKGEIALDKVWSQTTGAEFLSALGADTPDLSDLSVKMTYWFSAEDEGLIAVELDGNETMAELSKRLPRPIGESKIELDITTFIQVINIEGYNDAKGIEVPDEIRLTAK